MNTHTYTQAQSQAARHTHTRARAHREIEGERERENENIHQPHAEEVSYEIEMMTALVALKCGSRHWMQISLSNM